MYAFVDETGNTGENLFDEAQRLFITGALLTLDNFDVLCKEQMKELASSIGKKNFHANDLGIGRIENISLGLLDIFQRHSAHFAISLVDKIYLATTKVVDTIFDSGENLAVPWHSYNIRPLRLLLVFKVGFLLDIDLARRFWDCLMVHNEVKAYDNFVKACQELLCRVSTIPDERSREIISESLLWAINNPEAIYLHSDGKISRYSHLPNMVAFSNLLRGIEEQSILWNRSVKIITHDRQMQFEKSLHKWHELYSNAPITPMELPGEESVSLRCVTGSKLKMATDAESPGIQAIDIVLWLLLRRINI